LFLRLRQKIFKKWFSEEKENQKLQILLLEISPKQAQVLASLSGGVEGW
jgi:hypothetical protein